MSKPKEFPDTLEDRKAKKLIAKIEKKQAEAKNPPDNSSERPRSS